MTKATSSSERYEAARAALTRYETCNNTVDAWRNTPRLLAEALRALIEPAHVNKNIDDIVQEIASDEALWSVREKIEAGIQAGIQAAWESWEYDMYAPDSEASGVAYAWNNVNGNYSITYVVEEN